MSRHPLTGYPAFRPLEEIERLRTERDTAIAHLDDADKENDRLREKNQRQFDRIGRLGEERDSLRDRLTRWCKQATRAESRLSAIREIAEGYEDGAPDAPAWVRAFMTIAGICDGEYVR